MPRLCDHLAILQEPYLGMVLSGKKAIECRLTRQRIPPFGQIRGGDRVLLKRSSGPVMGIARVRDASCIEVRDREELTRLRDRHNDAIGATADYWRSRWDHPYLSLITLDRVGPVHDVTPPVRSSGRAWFLLESGQFPAAMLEVTEAGWRNRYLRVPASDRHLFPDGDFDILLEDRVIRTSLRAGYFRWRGWRSWFERQHLQPGDHVWAVRQRTRRFEMVVPRSTQA